MIPRFLPGAKDAVAIPVPVALLADVTAELEEADSVIVEEAMSEVPDVATAETASDGDGEGVVVVVLFLAAQARL